ncbi:SMP-30/gluconolactonase/LRE family protein [Daejeonella sp.]|uniref:SMP-30/gluconolactonase/LRE family protein n=1 Tax=Daejeonella sp. TaxID=2805397 RepID=UPI0030BDAD9F
MMKFPQLANADNSTCLLGESPIWDAINERILWLDILNREIHQFYPDFQEHKIVQLDKIPGCITLNVRGELLAAVEDGFAAVDIETGGLTMLAEVEKGNGDNRFNDGKCDARGRFWAGTMSMSGKPGLGSVYALETNGSVTLKIEGVGCSNGMAWSPDNTKFYYIDSPTKQVVSYDFDLDSGEICGKRVIISFSSGDGTPDGMTIDSEGMIWIALWDGWEIVRVNPVTGHILESVPLPVSRVTSCTFGGDQLQDLYITSARIGLTGIELKKQPFAGALFVIKNAGFQGFNIYKI